MTGVQTCALPISVERAFVAMGPQIQVMNSHLKALGEALREAGVE